MTPLNPNLPQVAPSREAVGSYSVLAMMGPTMEAKPRQMPRVQKTRLVIWELGPGRRIDRLKGDGR